VLFDEHSIKDWLVLLDFSRYEKQGCVPHWIQNTSHSLLWELQTNNVMDGFDSFCWSYSLAPNPAVILVSTNPGDPGKSRQGDASKLAAAYYMVTYSADLQWNIDETDVFYLAFPGSGLMSLHRD
jgi:hypothetical protein